MPALLLLLFLIPTVHSTRQQCCIDAGVPEKCYKDLCNPSVTPKVIMRYKLFERDIACQPYLVPVSKCLSKGRDVSSCCYKKSYDIEFDHCLGLCNGTMNYQIEKKNNFLSCFVLNVEAIFQCLSASYSNAPSEPQNLEIVSKTENSAFFRWSEPAEMPELVHMYKLHVVERKHRRSIETVHITKDLEFNLEGLSTKSSYSVFVVAHADIYEDDVDWNKSIFSNIISFTTASEIAISTEELKLPPTAESAQISCFMRTVVGLDPIIEWRKQTAEEVTVIEPNDKYSVVYYNSDLDPETLMSAVKINSIDESDFGTYRCYIKGSNIEYSETIIKNFVHSDEAPNENPPDTIKECCSKGVHRTDCLSVCNGIDVEKTAMIRPGVYLPPAKCTSETDKLFKCSLSFMNSEACCIHNKVPFTCMGMCDNRFEMANFSMDKCKKWMTKIYSCQISFMNLKPEAVSFVKIIHEYSDNYRFSWDKALDAKVYHIYNRKNNGKWDSRVTVDHSVDVTDSDEVVLLSVNEFGYSQQHRLFHENGGWLPVDHWCHVTLLLTESTQNQLSILPPVQREVFFVLKVDGARY